LEAAAGEAASSFQSKRVDVAAMSAGTAVDLVGSTVDLGPILLILFGRNLQAKPQAGTDVMII
jgi:hypothetical protein